jgi:hypothetical protein
MHSHSNYFVLKDSSKLPQVPPELSRKSFKIPILFKRAKEGAECGNPVLRIASPLA